MNKKGYMLLGIIGAIIALALCIYFYSVGLQDKKILDTNTSSDQPSNTTSPTVLLKSATIVIPDERQEVSLIDGRGRYVIEDNGSFGDISVETERVSKLGNYIVAPFGINSGGTGYFMYAGLFEETSVGLFHRDSVFLGDRIIIKNLDLASSTDKIILTTTFLDRAPDAAFTDDPSVENTLVFNVKNGRLVSVDNGGEVQQ